MVAERMPSAHYCLGKVSIYLKEEDSHTRSEGHAPFISSSRSSVPILSFFFVNLAYKYTCNNKLFFNIKDKKKLFMRGGSNSGNARLQSSCCIGCDLSPGNVL